MLWCESKLEELVEIRVLALTAQEYEQQKYSLRNSFNL